MVLRQLIEDYFKKAKLMQIATAKNNKPWVAIVWFAYDEDFNFYFISQKQRRHSLEIKENENISGTIVLPHKTLGVKVRGIQFEGKGYEISALELPRAFKLFVKRFPNAKDNIGSVRNIVENITKVRFYKIIPS